jgi:DNA-binding response OmpR family regulator
LQVLLTSKEFGLLEYTVTRAGRAMARSEILDRIWGTSVIVTDRSVDRCVTTLRSKIEANPSKPAWIKTIRNVGYRFEAE